jgi:hypothetical protein
MAYLDAEWKEYLTTLTIRPKSNFPPHVADAINIIRHEKIPRERYPEWLWDDGSPCDPQAREIADGKVDELKQNAFYVGIAKDGRVSSVPAVVSKESATAEFERTEQLRGIIRGRGGKVEVFNTVEYSKVSDTFKALFGLMSTDEYDKRWSG